jgi:hypothetical protein
LANWATGRLHKWCLGQSRARELFGNSVLPRRCPGRVTTGALLAGNVFCHFRSNTANFCPSHRSGAGGHYFAAFAVASESLWWFLPSPQHQY